ncbi:MAG: flagellar motor switch protein FliM [Nitrospinae bacterium]|nr:flagellar motor switch protein FliM [Nitrospinota bacterium]MBI3814430.1 flagellar motor switch protein FliM [Nitrospinota bacterium]
MAQILSQEEVDALLRGVSDGEIETETEEVVDESGVVTYDLTSQERIIRGRMPTLDIINQRFSRLFRNSLSAALRKVLDVSAVSTDTVKFGEFIKSLPVPASLHIFKMEPLRGFALLIAESKLVFALVDTFFGGTGSSAMKIEGRDFTTIEQRMIKKVVLMALEELEKAWKPVHNVNISFVRSEVNPQFAAIVPPTDVVVVIIFEIEMDQVSGTITVCLPYSTIEPIIGKLRAGFQSDQLEVDQMWIRRLRERMVEAQVDVMVELGRTKITSRDLMNFKAGDIIQLDNDVSDELIIKVEGVTKFKGYPGTTKGSKAVQVSSIIARGGKKYGG